MSLKAKIIGLVGIVSVLLLPSFAAAAAVQSGYVDSALSTLVSWVVALVPLLIGVALVVFMWGVIRYITAGADEEQKKAARGAMIWGVIALFVIVGVWGLVRLLAYTLNVGLGGSVPNPDFTGGRSGGGVPIVPVP